jgi:hypothetical protein
MERWRGPDRLEIVADELGPSLRCAAPEITPRYHRPDTIMLLGVAGSPWDEPRAPETTGRTRETVEDQVEHAGSREYTGCRPRCLHMSRRRSMCTVGMASVTGSAG